MLLTFVWAVGIVMFMAGCVVQPRSQAPLCFFISIVFLAIAVIWTKNKVSKSNAIAKASQNVRYDPNNHALTILNRAPENEVIFKIDDVNHLNFKYNPAELVYTGATTGSVSMGGFHINEESMSAGLGGKTGKHCIVYVGSEAKDKYCKIDKIHLSYDMVKCAKANSTVSQFLKDDTLILKHTVRSYSSDSNKQISRDAFNAGRMDIFYALNSQDYVDMQLTHEECRAIVSWLTGK